MPRIRAQVVHHDRSLHRLSATTQAQSMYAFHTLRQFFSTLMVGYHVLRMLSLNIEHMKPVTAVKGELMEKLVLCALLRSASACRTASAAHEGRSWWKGLHWADAALFPHCHATTYEQKLLAEVRR